ncbi:MAG: hypothetical protein QOF16_921 [Actinomycetota bacterium]|nr:hypothetical protein [Actinomycetota bacterium]MEA2487267.1 hypothetical protein [Actinomycetota bacterium]
MLTQLRQGFIGTTDVCDAHPELLRAGKNIGEELERPCPICSHDALRIVRYVYGDELRTNSGRVVYPAEWLAELAKHHDSFTCYVVEVCVDCSWNYLMRAFQVGRRWVSASDRNGSRAGREVSPQ